MSTQVSPVVLCCTIIVAMIVTAIYTATQVKFKSIRWVCGSVPYFVGMWVILLLGVLFATFSLRHLNSSYDAITHKATNRAQVKAILSNFRETKVTVNDIPTDWRGIATPTPTSTIYRYDFLTVPFSIHIIYDKQERIVTVIPSYE